VGAISRAAAATAAQTGPTGSTLPTRSPHTEPAAYAGYRVANAECCVAAAPAPALRSGTATTSARRLKGATTDGHKADVALLLLAHSAVAAGISGITAVPAVAEKGAD